MPKIVRRRYQIYLFVQYWEVNAAHSVLLPLLEASTVRWSTAPTPSSRWRQINLSGVAMVTMSDWFRLHRTVSETGKPNSNRSQTLVSQANYDDSIRSDMKKYTTRTWVCNSVGWLTATSTLEDEASQTIVTSVEKGRYSSIRMRCSSRSKCA